MGSKSTEHIPGQTGDKRRPEAPPTGPRLPWAALWLGAAAAVIVLVLFAGERIWGTGSTHSHAGPGPTVGASAAVTPTSDPDAVIPGLDTTADKLRGLSPVSPTAFDAPIAGYRSYAERWAGKLSAELPVLRAALEAGARSQAQTWSVAYSDYLHLGAVYGFLPGTLDQRIDGLPRALGPSASEARFSGLHRIEMGLWSGASPNRLVPWVSRLAVDVATLRRVLPTVAVAPLDYATRAHEILEDAQRDLLSGTHVPWSGAGVLGTAAGLAATQEVISTLVPVLQARGDTLVEVETALSRLQSAFSVVTAAHGGRWPSLDQLKLPERELLNGTLAGALGALSLVPGTLETTPVPKIPPLHQS